MLQFISLSQHAPSVSRRNQTVLSLPGLLQPLPVPNRAWKVISLDFTEGLPVSGSFNCILVVVDMFSKSAHFLVLKHPFTASSVAGRGHGPP